MPTGDAPFRAVHHPDPASSPATSDPTGGTADTADSGEVVEPSCTEPLVEGPVPVTRIDRIHTEEDFDFDAAGHLVAQDGTSLVGYWHDAPGVDVLSGNIGLDAAGIRTLPSGDFLVAQPGGGVVKRVDGVSGATVNVLTGLSFPDGLEVGRDGSAYVAEFAFAGGLRQFDPYAGDSVELLPDSPINAIALSPDEQTLYVSSFGYGANPFDGIASLARSADGTWALPATPIIPADALIQGLTTDVCGNLYAVVSETGEVYRWSIDDGRLELLAHLGTAGYDFYSSARFGAGHGGWERDVLYVTDRTALYALEVGIDGRHVLADP